MKKIASALLLSAFAASAFAADQNFYVGGNFGQASTDYANVNSKTGTAFTLLGGYQVNNNFAVEAQYGNLGSFAPTAGSKAAITQYGVTAVGIWPFNEQWSAYGKLGFASTSMKIDAGVVQAAAYTSTKSAVTYGVGGQFNVNQNLGLRFGYDSYDVGDTTINTAKTTVISAGVVYKF